MDTEQIFDSTQETAYRLCCLDPNVEKSSDQENIDSVFGINTSNESVFCCQWDPNKKSRLFICTQTGRLYVNDFETNRISSYHLIFQPYTSGTKELLYNEVSDEKIIHYHWDKLCLIPNRPDQFMFLLGISNKVLHSSLPNPLPNSSKSKPHTLFTNRDVSDFIYGSPVLELYSHSNRIMSMGICSGGQVLASGGEDGRLNLLSVQLLDVLSSADDSLFSSIGGLNKLGTLPVYKLTRRIHDGPIFALHWLESYCTGDVADKEYRHCLATGSNDRTIHIWTVVSSGTIGVQLFPLLNLSVISSNILCISSFLHYDNSVEMENSLVIQSKYILPSNYDLVKALQLPSPYSYYIAIGTHVGTVCLYRINKADLVKAMDDSNPIMDIDDGRFLHSMIVSCDRPIITISLASSMWKKMESNGEQRIVMSASDTNPSMKLFVEADFIDGTKRKLAWRKNLGPIAFFQELTHSKIVVSSTFMNKLQVSMGKEADPQSARLVVITVDGKIHEISI